MTILDTPRYPAGTPEHAAYMAELLPELEKWSNGEGAYAAGYADHMSFINYGLTVAARTALVNCGTNRQGATPPATTSADALHELTKLGILGRGNGLTRKGTIKRQQLMDALLDDLFGEES